MRSIKTFFFNFKSTLIISYGIVYILFSMWVLFNIENYFPVELQDQWFKIVVSYMILNAMIFGVADIRNKLFSVNILEFLPRFALFFVASILVSGFLFVFFDPMKGSLFEILKNVPIWLAVINAVLFATTESLIWQGYLDQAIGMPWSQITAGIFHMNVWNMSPFISIIGAAGLFLVFSLTHYLFKKSDKDFAPVIGVHSGYNMVKLGIILTPALLFKPLEWIR